MNMYQLFEMSDFARKFLKMSNIYTLIAIILLVLGLLVMKFLKDKKVSFSIRMLVALVIGLSIGIIVEFMGSTVTGTQYYDITVRGQINAWYGILARGFIYLIQLLAIPVVFLSIVKVLTEVRSDVIKTLSWKTFTLLLGTTAMAACVGIVVVKLFGLSGSTIAIDSVSKLQMERFAEISSQSFPEFFTRLIPNNIFAAFSDNSKIVSVVIIAFMFASAIRFLKVKKPEQVQPFVNFIDSTSVVISSVLTNVIKVMPYAIIALVANTLIAEGLTTIYGMIRFIIALYVAVLIMLVVHAFLLIAGGYNPITYFKKAFSTLLFAFSSRSSVGTLPLTLKTLESDMGTSKETANFVATLGTTIGMNGCAGVFPAMLAIIVGSLAGVQINLGFYLLTVIVVTIGSIGIAGVPGTATVAATVTLNGVGLGNYMSQIGAILGIDPIIDMARTMLNVSGSMVSALLVDKWEGRANMAQYNVDTTKEQE